MSFMPNYFQLNLKTDLFLLMMIITMVVMAKMNSRDDSEFEEQNSFKLVIQTLRKTATNTKRHVLDKEFLKVLYPNLIYW